jgi:hypothetical protein
MSFIDDILDVGKSAVGFLGGSGIGSALARTAITGYALSKLSASINKDNQSKDTSYSRIQVDPDTEHKIPVVYGQAVVSGIVTDAALVNDNKSMYYVITLCEKTGNLNLGAGAASSFTFNQIYWDDNLLAFDTDGITVINWTDRDGNVDTTPNGLIRVWCFAGNSTTPVVPTGYTNSSLVNAYSVMPDWTSNHNMSDLVFAIVRIDYNVEDKKINQLGNMKFKLTNSMSLPGDCMYDYMTNTRYGAALDPTEISVS